MSDSLTGGHFGRVYGVFPGRKLSSAKSDKVLTVRRECGKMNGTTSVLQTHSPPLTGRHLEGGAAAMSHGNKPVDFPVLTKQEVLNAISLGVAEAFPYSDEIFNAIHGGCRGAMLKLDDERRVRGVSPPRSPRTKRKPNKQLIPNEIRWAVWERDNFTCRACGARRHLSVDHILAESKGGLLTLENCQTLCRTCNSRKGNR